MAFSLSDIINQLTSLGGGGSNYSAPNNVNNGGAGVMLDSSGNLVNTNNALNSLNGSSSTGLGLNLGTGQMALSGLTSLSNLINGNKAINLAEDQFKFQKNLANSNLNNQIKSYNTSLEDRLTSRGVTEGTDAATVADQIAKRSLTR